MNSRDYNENMLKKRRNLVSTPNGHVLIQSPLGILMNSNKDKK